MKQFADKKQTQKNTEDQSCLLERGHFLEASKCQTILLFRTSSVSWPTRKSESIHELPGGNEDIHRLIDLFRYIKPTN